MSNYNRVILAGRLTRQPELKYTPSGTAVSTFTLAINRKFNKEETDFIDVTVWRQQAEYVANYGDKGRLVLVEGRIQTRSYETQDGQKRKVTEVVCDDVKFLDKQKSGGEQTRKDDDGWSDLGKEVKLEDIDLPNDDSDDQIPF